MYIIINAIVKDKLVSNNLFDTGDNDYFSSDDAALAQAELDLVIASDNEEYSRSPESLSSKLDIKVFSRDWTVQTVISQIESGNIDLNPDFQRRNAWTDKKKSTLIESYLLDYPVPEIVLAEHPKNKSQYIVIDGKQRLLTLTGFVNNEKYQSWSKDRLTGLSELEMLNKKSFDDLKSDQSLQQYVRILGNADVRCTVITNVDDDQVLYDIFYRLISGATPLSVQELRQVLYAGEFTKYLINFTDKVSSIHKVLKLSEPDNRLKDIETILRLLAFTSNASQYTGNLKSFLDSYTDDKNNSWEKNHRRVENQVDSITRCIDELANIFGCYTHIGRKYLVEKSKFDSRFNTVLLEVSVYFHLKLMEMGAQEKLKTKVFLEEYKLLFQNSEFMLSISSSTKNIKSYTVRYNAYQRIVLKASGIKIAHPWE